MIYSQIITLVIHIHILFLTNVHTFTQQFLIFLHFSPFSIIQMTVPHLVVFPWVLSLQQLLELYIILYFDRFEHLCQRLNIYSSFWLCLNVSSFLDIWGCGLWQDDLRDKTLSTLYQKYMTQLGIVVLAFNPNTRETGRRISMNSRPT